MESVLVGDLLRGTVLDEEFFGKKGFVSRKVKVRIIRREGGWLPPEHEASVMMQDSKRIFCAPTSSSRQQLVNPLAGLTTEQLRFLAKKMGLKDEEDFNIHKKEENFWNKFEITLTRDGALYDLADPVSFLKWATLRSDTEKIAPTWDDRFMKGTYQFALIEEGEEDNQKLDKADKMKEAYRLYGRLEVSEAKMRDFLWVYFMNYKGGNRPPKQATPKFLQTQIADIVENNTDRFLELANDPDYETKLLIQKAIDVHALAFRKGKYYVGEDAEPIGGLQDIVEYLDDDKNQQDRMKIIHLIDQKKEE